MRSRRGKGYHPSRTRRRVRLAGVRSFQKPVVVALLLIMAGGLGLIGYEAVGRSGFFRIAAIDIEGCERLEKEEILRLSGVDVHSNLVRIGRSRVKEAVEGHRWVARAEVVRKWPDRLLIAVREREPVAIVNLGDGLHYIDKSGEIFAPLTPGGDLDYPVISGLAGEGGRPAADAAALEEVLLLIKYAGRDNPNLPLQNISEFRIAADGIAMFLTDRPFPIRLGRGEMWTKYNRLAKVLYWLYKRREFSRVSYVNVDYEQDLVLVGMGPG